MRTEDFAGDGDASFAQFHNRNGDPPMLGRKSVLMGILTSGFVIANGARPSDAMAAGTVAPIAATQPTYAPKWTPSTPYTLGQQVISPNNDVASANVAHKSSAAFDTDATKWNLSSTFARGVSITAGANPASTSASNNANMIQSRINLVAAAGGGIVFIPAGTWITGPLTMRTRVTLMGEGWASILKLVNEANTHMITLASAQVEQAAIVDLWLDGNKANQTSGDVLHFDSTGYNTGISIASDPSNLLKRVMVFNGKESGLVTKGVLGALYAEGLQVFRCDGIGIHLYSPDNMLNHCIVGFSGLQGIYLETTAASNRFMGCKVFCSGNVDARQGQGYMTSFAPRVDMTHCEAQDNRSHGFCIIGATQSALVNCKADRNGLGPEPITTGGFADGIYISKTTYSLIELTTGDRGSTDGTNTGPLLQGRGFNCGPGNDYNTVRLAIGGTKNGAGVGSWGRNSSVTYTHNGTAVVIPPLGIADNFGATFDTTKWSNSTGTVSTVSGRLRASCTSGYSTAISGNVVNFTAPGGLTVGIPTLPEVGTGSTQASFDVKLGSNSAGFVIQGAPRTLQMHCTGLSNTTIVYDAAAHAYLRLRYSDGSIVWETSQDALTWTVRATGLAPPFLTQSLLRASLGSGYYGAETSPGYAEFENFNL